MSERNDNKREFDAWLRKVARPVLESGNKAVREWYVGRDSYDPFGSVMSEFFDVADILYAEGAVIPDEWAYRHGAGSSRTVQEMAEEGSALAQLFDSGVVSLDDIRELGDLLSDASEMARELLLDY
jgi:hypothetical protein